MKIKLDENLPIELVQLIAARGHDVDSVPAENLAGHDDTTVWTAAQGAGRLLITQDLDFSDIRSFAPGSHHGVILIRLRNPSRRALISRIEALFESGQIENWPRCFVVVTERKVRVRRP